MRSLRNFPEAQFEMERPDFIKIIISSLLFDLVLIFLAPLLGYAFLLVLLVLLYGIPSMWE